MRARSVVLLVLVALLVGIALWRNTTESRAPTPVPPSVDVSSSGSGAPPGRRERRQATEPTSTTRDDSETPAEPDASERGGLAVIVTHDAGSGDWKPLAGAVFEIEDPQGNRQSATSGTNGAATIRGAAGNRRMVVRHPGYQPYMQQAYLPDSGVATYVIRVLRGVPIEVRVLDSEGRTPIAGARVDVHPGFRRFPSWRGARQRALGKGVTNEDGRWRFDAVARNQLSVVVVEVPDRPRREVPFRAPGPGPESIEVLVPHGRFIEGVVHPLEGTPPHDIHVHWRPAGLPDAPGTHHSLPRVRCNDDLRFRIGPLQPDGWYVVRASDGRRWSQDVTLYLDESARPVRTELLFEPHRPVTFRVLAPDGRPMDLEDQVEISVTRRDPTTNADGLPSLGLGPSGVERLPEGRYRVSVYANDWRQTWKTEVDIGRDTSVVTLRPPALHSISGRVVDSDGRPVPEASVELSHPTAPDIVDDVETGADGTFAFTHLVEGPWVLHAYADDHAILGTSVHTSEGPRTLRLQKAATVLLAFPAAWHDRPVEIDVLIPALGKETASWAEESTTGSRAGLESLEDLPPGKVKVRVQIAGALPWERVFDLAEGETRRVDIDSLDPGVRLHGVVRDLAGRGVAGAQVQISGASLVRSATTDENGRFDGVHVEPGAVELWLSHPELTFRRVHLDATGTEMELDLTLGPGTPVHIAARDAAGRPAVGVTLRIEDGHGRVQRSDIETDHRGEVVTWLPAGTWRIVGESGTLATVRVDGPGRREVAVQVR